MIRAGPAAAAALVALALGACECVSFPEETSFLCEDGACPDGYVCSADGYCDLIGFVGPDGGGGSGGGDGDAGPPGLDAGFSFTLGPCAQTWCWDHPTPWGDVALRGVATSGANDAWVVGDNGAVFHWNGDKWQQVATTTRSDLNDVWISREGEVWAVGSAGTVQHLESGRFIERGRPTLDDLRAIDGVSARDFFVAGTNARVSHYQDGGWVDLLAAPAADFDDVSAADPLRTLAVGGTLQHWSSAMLVPREAPSAALRSVWVNPGGEAWLGTAIGGLFKSEGALPDAGTGWTQVSSLTSQPIAGLWGTAAQEVYYGSAEGLFTTGASFSGKVSQQSNITSVAGTAPSNIWAASLDGPVIRRTITGGQFSDQRQLSGATTNDLNAVAFNSDGTAFAVGANDIALKRNALGQWSTVSVEGAQSAGILSDVWSSGFDSAVAVGPDPVRLATYDAASGTFKKPVGFVPSSKLNAVWGSAPDKVFAGGDGTYLIKWDGSTWTQVTGLPKSFRIEGIWGTAPDNYFVVGQSGIILHFDGNVWGVELDQGGGPVLAVGGAWPDDVYAVGGSGMVLHREVADGGWTAESTGAALTYTRVATVAGVTMLTSLEGEVMKKEGDGGWKRVGTGTRGGLKLNGVAGAASKGFLAVGEGATVLRWAP